MTTFQWMIAPLKKYADFSGRARRKEYWLFRLFLYLTEVLLSIILSVFFSVHMAGFFQSLSQMSTPSQIFGTMMELYSSMLIFCIPLFLFSLAVFIPHLAVAIRRLHDQGKSGWWYCVIFIPFAGAIWFIILMATEGNPGPNQYGPDPKAAERGYGYYSYQQPPYQGYQGYPPQGGYGQQAYSAPYSSPQTPVPPEQNQNPNQRLE